MPKLFASFLLILTVFIHIQCRNTNSQNQLVVQQDSTITPQTAITQLVFDSVYVDQFIQKHQFMQDTAQRILNFYISRNFQYAWFTEDGVAEQTRTFWNLRNFYITSNRSNLLRDTLFEQSMERILNDSTYQITPEEQANTELKLTHHFFAYAQYAYAGTIDPESLQWHIPRKKLDVVALLDSLVTNRGNNLEQWEPVNNVYMNLQSKLKDYAALDEKGGWDTLPVSQKTFSKGNKDSILLKLKQRLAWEDTSFVADSVPEFDEALQNAVNRARARYGMLENGKADAALVRELNVSVKKRIEQILINMERARWLPPTEGNVLIVANIPDYRLRVFEDNNVVLSMNIVVGTVANNSVIFNDELKYIVFAPYWNVPMSIARNEIVPAMRRNKNYLARNNMEITGYNNGIPVVRQKPGKSNSLGLVKFLFPNSYNIYFHDTPSKSLFEREQRAFSHGCIRLQKPFELAKYLLRNQPEWTEEKMQQAMNGSKETWVTLPQAIPVMITYFTAWVDVDLAIHFNKDVYGHDKKLAARLFSNTDLTQP
ncbi:MAG: L,D-transpeptidase family protein [Ferruginibacter sp.]|nr:L,D-transpeptidase family protein [Ferruginibacter sp.]